MSEFVESDFSGIKIIGAFIIILFLIFVSNYFYHSFIKGEEQVYIKEFIEERCYLVGCSALGCSRIEIDCDSSDVDIKEDIYKTKCEWVKK